MEKTDKATCLVELGAQELLSHLSRGHGQPSQHAQACQLALVLEAADEVQHRPQHIALDDVIAGEQLALAQQTWQMHMISHRQLPYNRTSFCQERN